LGRNPFSGTIFVFRAKRADGIKIVAWDGFGLVLFWKRLEHDAFRWPPVTDGAMRLTSAQLAALVDGMDWSRGPRECRAVADSLEVGDRLFTFTRPPPIQWRSARAINAICTRSSSE
jgi:transposase